MTGRLVAIDLAGGPDFVDALRSIWDADDAAFVVDRRLPAQMQRAQIAQFGAAAVRDEAGEHRLAGPRPVAAGDALVVATSGASGAPKGVVLTHQAVAASAIATSTRLGVTADDRWLACLPLSHIGGLSVVTRAIVTGTALTVHDGFDAAAVDACTTATQPATLVSLVATALQRIDAAAWRRIVLGGAPPPAALPDNVVTTYGMTETGSGVVYDGIPLDGVELRTVDGEIQVRGPMLLRCYRDDHDPRTADGWLPTGDIGELTAHGRLTITGRRSDLIISGGENVWPEPIERILRGHPAIADVAVVATPEPEWGQVVTAVVVAQRGGVAPTLSTIRELVKGELPTYCAPRRLVVVDELPRTSLGKLRRQQIAEQAEASHDAAG